MRAFLFPGQGSQSVGMGAPLAEASRAARDVFGEVDEALGQNLFRLMREGPEDELKLTENAQPAIMANAIAVFAALTREGKVELKKSAQFVAGHSALASIRRCARPGRSGFRRRQGCSGFAARRCSGPCR
jgi:[acyl-carrier-protein] S-malonyltransferase